MRKLAQFAVAAVIVAGITSSGFGPTAVAQSLPAAPQSAPALQPVPGNLPLTIERLFADPALNGPAARAAKLSPDGTRVTWLRAADDDFLRFDLWSAPVAGGPAAMLVDSRRLVPAEGALSEEEKARRERQRIAGFRGIVDYAWDTEGKAVLVPLGGDLHYVNVATPDQPRQLTNTPQFETDAKISPRGGYVSFIRDGTLHAIRLADNASMQLSPAAQGAVTYGMAEFIAQEEMDRDTGYWWSPDDLRVAYAAVDETPVAMVQRVEIGAAGTVIQDQRYPKAGTANALVSLHVRDVASGATRKVDLGPEADIYLSRVDWSVDGRTLYVQRQNRAQTRLDILMVDPATGTSRVIVSETAKGWVNLTHDFRPLANGDFLWTSERSGWRHIERRGRDGSNPRALTSGDWAVTRIVGVDEAKSQVYFLSNKADVVGQSLFAASTAVFTPSRQISPSGGVWTAEMARRGGAWLGGYSDPKTPARFGLYDAEGRLSRWIEENRLDPAHPWWPYFGARATREFGTMEGAGGVKLTWALTKPANFDPSKRWPVIVQVYGGPGVQNVTRGWGSNVDQLYAARGYLVFSLDNRGTPNRGRAFEQALSRNVGLIEVEDQLTGLAWLKAQPFVDPARIGVNGWSYGGYMALRLATEAPDAFAAHVSGAPVTDWALYDTHYTERYLGTPAEAGGVYDRASVIPRLKDVRRPLLILHGMADDNVIFENATLAFDALQVAGVPFEAMVYPGQKHGIRDKARAAHVQRTILSFFDRHIGPGPKPAD
jgi:dipeptidyl-peptidase 4